MTETAVSVMPPGAGGRVLDFRRRGTPPRRKRRSVLWTLAKPLAVALALVGLPAGLVAWVLTAPLFGLRDIEVLEVRGTARRVSRESVRQALAPLQGKNLVRLSLAEAAARVERNPWIESVEMAKELPGRLHVKFAARRPVALLLADGGLVYADSEGKAIAPVTTPAELEEARSAGLLVVSFVRNFAHKPHKEGVGSALRAAADLGRAQPTWASKLSRIEVLGEEDFRLHTDALPFPLLVRSGQVKPKVERLVELLPELSRRYVRIEAVDLRFARRIVVQPALSTPPPGGTGA